MRKFDKLKILSFILVVYLCLGVRFYIVDLQTQQKYYGCPHTIDPSLFEKLSDEELIQFSEKYCMRNRSTLDKGEVSTAITLILLWFPLLVGQGLN